MRPLPPIFLIAWTLTRSPLTILQIPYTVTHKQAHLHAQTYISKIKKSKNINEDFRILRQCLALQISINQVFYNSLLSWLQVISFATAFSLQLLFILADHTHTELRFIRTDIVTWLEWNFEFWTQSLPLTVRNSFEQNCLVKNVLPWDFHSPQD